MAEIKREAVIIHGIEVWKEDLIITKKDLNSCTDSIDALRYSIEESSKREQYLGKLNVGWDWAKRDDLVGDCDDPVTTWEGEIEPV